VSSLHHAPLWYRWAKLALYCRVLFAQCALKIHQQIQRVKKVPAKRPDQAPEGHDQTPTAESNSTTADAASNSTEQPASSTQESRPSRQSRRSSSGGSGIDPSYHSALWAVVDVLVRLCFWLLGVNLISVPCLFITLTRCRARITLFNHTTSLAVVRVIFVVVEHPPQNFDSIHVF